MDGYDSRRQIWADPLLDTVDRWGGIDALPDPNNRRLKEGIRIFRADFVEKGFSKAHPVMPVVWAAPFIVLGLYKGFTGGHTGIAGTLGLFAAGVFAWTLLEYILHRFMFHMKLDGPRGRMYSFMIHGYHHEFPDDKMRLVAPPLMLFSLGFAAWLIFYLVLGPNYWAQVFAGTATGYVAYDWTHYYTHHFHPQRGIGKWLRQYHLMHHFEGDHKRFGISSPLWDFVFGTYRPIK